MEFRYPKVLLAFRALVEEDGSSTSSDSKDKSKTPSSKESPNKCPPGFKFDGKHCVPAKKGSKDALPSKPGSSLGSSIPSEPPKVRPDEENSDFPHTREHTQTDDKDIPLVPDPEHDVMQRPHNAITYANGQRSFEYAEDEWKEYGHNSFVQAKFPDAFADKHEFVNAFLNGEHGMCADWSEVQNCSAAKQEEGDYPSLFDKLWAFKGGDWAEASPDEEESSSKDQFKEYIDELVERANGEDKETTPPVVIGIHKDPTVGTETRWLVTGNSRALIYAFIGKPVPTRLVPLKGRMLPDPTDYELHNQLWPAEQADVDDDAKEQNVRAAVSNVISARGGQPAGGGQPQEDVVRVLKNIFLEATPYKHQSGHTKRLFKKLYKKLGYPVGTVRNWTRGKMVKTASGWEDVPAGEKTAKAASAPVPAAKHDEPTPSTIPSKTPSGSHHWIDSVPGFPDQTLDKHYDGFKKPKATRQKLHDTILSKFFDKVPAPSAEDLKTKKPVAVMLMGGPASGKSTIGSAYPDHQFVHLDPDAMKEHLPEYKAAIKWRAKNAAKMTHEESVHLMQQLREKTIAAKKNLVMDGTGRHIDSYLKMIKQLKTAGYHVKVVMADIDPELASKRAKQRQASGGRVVPTHIFDSAYHAVPRNFEEIASAGDDFELWDTRTDGAPSLKWEKTAGEEKIHDKDFVDKFRAKYSHKPHRVSDPRTSVSPKAPEAPKKATTEAISTLMRVFSLN